MEEKHYIYVAEGVDVDPTTLKNANVLHVALVLPESF